MHFRQCVRVHMQRGVACISAFISECISAQILHAQSLPNVHVLTVAHYLANVSCSTSLFRISGMITLVYTCQHDHHSYILFAGI